MFDLFKERQNIDSLEHGFDTYKVRDSHIDIFFVLIKLLIRIFDITVLFQKNDKELQFAKKCPCYEKIGIIDFQLTKFTYAKKSHNMHAPCLQDRAKNGQKKAFFYLKVS